MARLLAALAFNAAASAMQQLHESIQMTHQAAIHASQTNSSAHTAQKVLALLALSLEAKLQAAPFKALMEPSWTEAETEIDISLVPDQVGVPAPVQQDIATADWDILFRAIEERLGALVAEKPDQPITLPAETAATRNKEVVLECVSAMAQLHAALIQARQCHQPPKSD